MRHAARMKRDTIITADNGAELFDLILDLQAREDGCLGILLLDDDGRVLLPIVVHDLGTSTTVEQKVHAVGLFLGQAAEAGAAIAFCHGRPGRSFVTDEDRGWHEALITTARDLEVPVVGAWVAGDWGVRALPRPLAEHFRAG